MGTEFDEGRAADSGDSFERGDESLLELRARGASFDVSGAVSSNVSTCSGSNPGDTRLKPKRCATRMALAASSVKARAISATTSDCDSRRLLAVAVVRTPAFSTSAGTVRIACHSGAMLATRAGDQRASGGKEHDRPVERDFVGARNVFRCERDDDADERGAQEDAGHGASDRHQQSFHEVMQGELTLAGTEGDANGRFARARDRSREQQPGDICAGDEEQCHRGCDEEQQRRFDRQQHRITQIVKPRRVRRMRLRIERRNLGCRPLRRRPRPARR